MKNTLSTIAGISLFSFCAVNAAIAQEITASRLYTEFENNEIAAEGKYKGNIKEFNHYALKVHRML